MDIVIPVKPGRNNEELRYALRSFQTNLPHDRVWIVGARPHWAKNVNWIQTNQIGTKYQNTTLALETICTNSDVSEDFIYCNDDFFVMQYTDELPPYHRGPVIDVEKAYKAKYKNKLYKYLTGMTQTRELLHSLGHKNPLSYELHIPMIINKEKMLKVLDLGKDVQVLHKRTAYGNLTAMGGDKMRDVKVSTRGSHPYNNSQFLSTMADSFRYGAVGRSIRASFPNPSRYEPPPVRRRRK